MYRVPSPLYLLYLLVLFLAGCSSSQVSTRIVPESASVSHLAEFPYSGWVRVAHYPGGGFALFRTSPRGDGRRLLEGYNDTLGLIWSEPLPYYTEGESMLWLGHHSGRVVTAMERWQSQQDSIAVWAHSYDPLSGELRDSMRLGVLGNRSDDEALRVVPTRVLPSADTALLVSYTVDLIATRGRTGFDSVRVHADMFDAMLRSKSILRFDLPILHIAEPKDAEYRIVGRPVVDAAGRIYMALVVGAKTVRVFRLDVAGGSTSWVDISTPRVFPEGNEQWLQDLVLHVEKNGRVMVAASEHLMGNTGAITLYHLNFQRRAVELSRRIDIQSEILSRPDAGEMTSRFRLRDVLDAGDHGNLLLMEEVNAQGIPTRTRNAQGMRTTEYYATLSTHRAMVIIALDNAGATRWITIQKRPEMHRYGTEYIPDMWRIEGATLHYLTRNVLAGTIDLRNGSPSFPQLLVSTEMHPEYEFGRWFDARSGVLLMRSGEYNSVIRFRF